MPTRLANSWREFRNDTQRNAEKGGKWEYWNKQTNSGTYPGFGRLAQTDGRLTATSLIENELNWIEYDQFHAEWSNVTFPHPRVLEFRKTSMQVCRYSCSKWSYWDWIRLSTEKKIQSTLIINNSMNNNVNNWRLENRLDENTIPWVMEIHWQRTEWWFQKMWNYLRNGQNQLQLLALLGFEGSCLAIQRSA